MHHNDDMNGQMDFCGDIKPSSIFKCKSANIETQPNPYICNMHDTESNLRSHLVHKYQRASHEHLLSSFSKPLTNAMRLAINVLFVEVSDRISLENLHRVACDENLLSRYQIKDFLDNLVELLEKKPDIAECIEPFPELSTDESQYVKYLGSLFQSEMSNNVREPILFVPHCDDDECDLGSVQFQCLFCNAWVIDFDLWWKRDVIKNNTGRPLRLICNRCNYAMDLEESAGNFYLKYMKHGDFELLPAKKLMR